jgi:hypothetical protein
LHDSGLGAFGFFFLGTATCRERKPRL